MTPAIPDAHADAWEAVRQRGSQLAEWTDRAVTLAAEAAAAPPPGWLARRRGRRAAARAEQAAAARAVSAVQSGSRLRYIPPVAALGTAALLQVAAMTDLVGSRVAVVITKAGRGDLAAWGYGAGALLGIAVASCVEGGAAYLMDLYDKHLMARDSTWLLRVGMAAYVVASAGLLHWWLAYRHLPALVSWVLAGMSGLALFLWSRGSRWANRVEMRRAGHLDPAMPKLPAVAKLLHPWRSLVTLWLTSWEPVETPEAARQRYAEWREARRTITKAEHAPAEAPETDPGAPESTAAAAESGAPGDGENPAQRVRKDARTAQEIEDAVRAIATARPDLSRRKIAALANTPATNVRRILGASTAQPEEPAGAPTDEQAEGAA